MPLLDDKNAIGSVLFENKSTGNYTRSFMVIDFSTHQLKFYPEEAEFAANLSAFQVLQQINCQYITKVNAASTRPKVLNCLEIETTTGSYFVSVDTTEERDEWIDSITKASMRQSSRQKTLRDHKERATDRARATDGFRTNVVGGVVQRTPIAASNGERLDEGAEGATEQQQDGAKVRRRGFPRIIKAGHGIKLGAVMKNWKRRFFVLTELSLSYYKSLEELEPIKSVSVGEVTTVSAGSRSREVTGREHLFEVVTPNRTFFVQVDSSEDMEDWVRVFNDLIRAVKPHGQVSEGSESDIPNSTTATTTAASSSSQQVTVV